MYKPLQKKNSSWTPTTAQKKSNSSSKLGHFPIQPKSNKKSSQSPEIGEYSRDSADRLAANVMRSLQAKDSQETETPTVQPQSESRISVADVVGQRMPTVMAHPLTPQVSMASQVVPENRIQKQCADCASPQQEQSTAAGKDIEQISSETGAIQTKLTVGAPGDPYEQEADRVAAQVVSMSAPPDNSAPVQRLAQENNPIQRGSLAQSITPVVQRRLSEQVQTQGLVQRAFQAGGTEASGDLESRLNASKGGGSPLSEEVRAFMEPRFGSDFSGVRVHTGSEAVQMNRELGAQAFTHGSDIYFGSGKAGNNELTAHELTHVVQQTSPQIATKSLVSSIDDSAEREADNVAQRVLAGASVDVSSVPQANILRAVVETYGGEFEDITYKDASSTDATGFINRPSAEIEIEFRANELVDCPKFGMTQTINAQREGSPFPVRPEVTGRSTTLAEEGEEGRYLDRAGGRENPMYGVDNQPHGTVDPQLGGGTNASNSRWGHRIVKPDGTVDTEKEAYLYDKPRRPRTIDPVTGKGQTISQEFETTTLCVEGELAGTYLGSVRWGYQVDADNNFNLIPFSLVSMGAPTQTFMGAAQLWNDATVDMGGGTTSDTIDLPITSHQTVDPASLSDKELFQRIRQLADKIQAMERDERKKRTPDYQNRRFEARGLAREASRRGAVATDSGKTYTIISGDTLWAIAAAHLGSGVKWTQIFALNVINILDPNLIQPGQTLKMPEPYGSTGNS